MQKCEEVVTLLKIINEFSLAIVLITVSRLHIIVPKNFRIELITLCTNNANIAFDIFFKSLKKLFFFFFFEQLKWKMFGRIIDYYFFRNESNAYTHSNKDDNWSLATWQQESRRRNKIFPLHKGAISAGEKYRFLFELYIITPKKWRFLFIGPDLNKCAN